MVIKMMMKLGTLLFSVDTAAYQTISQQNQYRWQQQNRLGREPAYQYLGAGDTTLELEGVIYAHYKGGFGQVEAMRQEANQGKPLILVDGIGGIHGKWCIKSISETNSYFTSQGMPQKITFRLSIVKYGEDNHGTQNQRQ